MAMPYADEVLVEGRGSTVRDADGKEFLDLASGMFCCVLGHNHPKFIERISRQAGALLHTGTQFLSPPVLESSYKLAEVAPGRLQKCIFLSTGTEANEFAFRLAKAYTGRTGILGLSRGYYGTSLATKSCSSLFSHQLKDSLPTVPENARVPIAACLPCFTDGGHPPCGFPCLENLQDSIGDWSNIAAVIVEPILSAGGMLFPPSGYFKRLQEIAHQQGALFIVDEAQTGFGRTGKWFAIEHHDVEPDILSLSKSVGNGFPVAAVVTTAEIADHVVSEGLWNLSSHQSDPVPAAAVGAVIDIVREENLLDRARESGEYFLGAAAGPLVAPAGDRGSARSGIDDRFRPSAAPFHGYSRGRERLYVRLPPPWRPSHLRLRQYQFSDHPAAGDHQSGNRLRYGSDGAVHRRGAVPSGFRPSRAAGQCLHPASDRETSLAARSELLLALVARAVDREGPQRGPRTVRGRWKMTRAVLLVAPKPPPYGGVGLQAELLTEGMRQDGVAVSLLPSNPPFPAGLRACAKIPGLRTLLRSAVFCRQLWRRLPGVEVVHVLACSWVYFFFIVWPAVILSRVRRKRIVINYHGGQADHFLGRYGRLAKPVFRLAHVVTAPSGFLAKVLRSRLGVPVEIVPNIVDLTAFSYRERKMPAPRMLVTRHLEKLYGIETVLRAFREVQSRYAEASLRIAGTGAQESYLRGLATNWELRNVHFLGYVPYAELPAIYEQCDILLNASRADNFPGSLVEAAAAGLVVVSTGVGGIPYIFEDGESALLVEPGDWNALAGAILRVLEEPGLALRLARAALEQCRGYDWKNVRPLLYKAYGFERQPSRGREGAVAAQCGSFTGAGGR